MDDKPAYQQRADRAAKLRLKHARIISKAGIPADRREQVLDELESLFQVHAYRDPEHNQAPELVQGVIDAARNADKTERWAEKLQERLSALPVGLRFSILLQWVRADQGAHEGTRLEIPEGDWYRDGKHVVPDLPTEVVLVRAKLQLERIHRDRGRPRSELALLLFGLVVLFEGDFTTGGVINDGWHAEQLDIDEALDGVKYDRRYSGPLLDLVEKLLVAEGIEYKSRGALGAELWRLIQTANKVAR